MVQAGTLFGYLAAFMTIVIAIAFGDLAISVHRLLRARQRVIWHPIPLLAAFWVLLVLLTSFFAIWDLTALSHLSFYGLLWKITPLFLYFLAASAILPDEVPPHGVDLFSFYLSERGYFYTVLIVGYVLDNGDGLASNWSYLSTHPAFVWSYVLPVIAGTLACLVAMLWRTEKWVHWSALTVLFIASHFGFASWSIKGASAIG
jgi:hypothetical protein